MQPILTSLPALAVSALYCLYSMYRTARVQRGKELRDRVTYMLWVMANRVN